MQYNNSIPLLRIDDQLGGLGLIHKQSFPSVVLGFNSPHEIIELGNHIFMMDTKYLDIPFTARLELQSSNNSFVTSKKDYDSLNNSKYQLFSDFIEISLHNYGLEFIPFRLEFIKITPKNK